MWGPGRKMAFGAAPGPRSKLWYTLVDGNLSEVFFPTIDRVALHELRFFASAGGAPPVDDAGDGQHRVTWLAPGIPAFKVDSTHHEYRLTKEFFSDPDENAMLIAATFTPELPDVRLYMQASAHWQPGSEGNFGQVLDTHPPALLLRQQDVWMCIVGPFSRGTVGYYRSSDLQIDLHDGDGYLTYTYERAGPGNVAAGAEIGIRAGSFQIGIGFAHTRADAEEVARATLQKGSGNVRHAFERAWRGLPDLPPALSKVSGDDGMLAQASLAVLRCLEDKSHATATRSITWFGRATFVASRPRCSMRATRPRPFALFATCSRANARTARGSRTGLWTGPHTGRRPSSIRSRCRYCSHGGWASPAASTMIPTPSWSGPLRSSSSARVH
jgi:glucoamylase